MAPAEVPGTHRGCNTNLGRQSPGSEHLHLNPSCRVGCFALVLALRRTLATGKAARERGQGRVTSCCSGDICLGRGLRTRPKATTEATLASTPPPHHLNRGQPSSALSQGWGTPCRPLQGGGFHRCQGVPRDPVPGCSSAERGSCSQALAHKYTVLEGPRGVSQSNPRPRGDLPHPIPSHPIPSRPVGDGLPEMPHISALPAINKGGMRQLWLPGSASLLHWKGIKRALGMLVPLPLPRLPLCHCQPRGDSKGAQSCLLAPVPAQPQGGGQDPQDGGRSTNEKKRAFIQKPDTSIPADVQR